MFKLLTGKLLNKNKKTSYDDELPELVKSLEENIRIIKDIFNGDQLVVYRNLEVGKGRIKVCVIFTESMINKEVVNQNIIFPLLNTAIEENTSGAKVLDVLQEKVLLTGEIEKTSDMDNLIGSIIYGDTIVLVDSCDSALVMESKGWAVRAVSEPQSESVVRGPREGFIEALNINVSMIRRRIKSPDLKFKFKDLGSRTRTRICICYIDGLACEKILEELEKRLNLIEIDGILESGYIEELIKDSPLSPFNTLGNTERPDVVSAQLLEGRIALLCDGTPFALTLPYLFIEYFQVNEDYYQNFIFSSINRMIRMLGFFLSTSVPAIYTALITYHQEMIPTPLILSISAAREGVPFPTIFEALLMTLVFEIIREAGTRLPSPIGQTISIVGALVLGDAAVTARVVSAPMVIVVALTGLSSFLIPKAIGPVIVMRLIFLLLSAFLGLYGYIFGVAGLFIHLTSMRSFGVPYMLNTGSVNKQDLKDTAIRAPWWYMYYRPKLIADRDSVRKSSARREKKG